MKNRAPSDHRAGKNDDRFFDVAVDPHMDKADFYCAGDAMRQ